MFYKPDTKYSLLDKGRRTTITPVFSLGYALKLGDNATVYDSCLNLELR